MMTRTAYLKKLLFHEPRRVSLERALLYYESYKRTAGEPVVLRRAKALANILDKMEIVINDLELIVGGRSIKPRAGVVSPEMDIEWINNELDSISTRPQDRFNISEKDKRIFREILYPYWKNETLKDKVYQVLPEDVQKCLRENIFKLNQTDKGQGHIIPGYERILQIGLGGLLEKTERKLAHATDVDQRNFYQAAKIAIDASQRFILRYKDLALDLAKDKINRKRQRELETIARVCHDISTHPPNNFYEALQLFWLINVILQCESNASSLSPGRFDQYMYPLYKKDIEAGLIDNAFALELLECLWIKMNEVVAIRSEESAKHFAGFPMGYNIVLGGIDRTGRDATNELSFLCLKATENVALPQPNIGIRIHASTPYSFLKRAVEVIKLGMGMPQVFNDEVAIPAYLNRGVPLEDARNYGVVGCVELSIPGLTYGLHDIALFNLLRVLDLVVQSQDKYADFSNFMTAYKRKIEKGISLMIKGANIVDKVHSQVAPTPFLSLFIGDCLEKGLDVTRGGGKYNFSGVQGIGIANVADSLEVLRKEVFGQNKLSFSKLRVILGADYQGYEMWQEHFINKVEKYGNDHDGVDELASKVLNFYCKEVEKYTNIRGGVFQPGAYTVSAHIPLGEDVGASPDGRNAHQQLADGGLSPMVGRDKKGPTAVLKSVAKLDSYLLSNGSLLNQKFHPSVLEGNEGIERLVQYLRAFSALKILHIQFNIISAKTLRKAQKSPDDYRSLVIRVAGYSAFFTELDQTLQNDIIRRTEHGM